MTIYLAGPLFSAAKSPPRRVPMLKMPVLFPLGFTNPVNLIQPPCPVTGKVTFGKERLDNLKLIWEPFGQFYACH